MEIHLRNQWLCGMLKKKVVNHHINKLIIHYIMNKINSRTNIAMEQRVLALQQTQINKDLLVVKAGNLEKQDKQNDMTIDSKMIRKFEELPREDKMRNKLDEKMESRVPVNR